MKETILTVFQNFFPGSKLNHILWDRAWESILFTNFCFRYATWLELYARLDAEERAGAGRERLAALTKEMMEHEEGFLDKYRCLSCWDGGMRDTAKDSWEDDGQVELNFIPFFVCFNVFLPRWASPSSNPSIHEWFPGCRRS